MQAYRYLPDQKKEMKFLPVLLCALFNYQNSKCQNFDSLKRQLDTSIFDLTLYTRCFLQSSISNNFNITQKLEQELYNIAKYNSYIGQRINSDLLTVKFNYENKRTINSINVFYENKKIKLIPETGNNGFVLTYAPTYSDGVGARITFEKIENKERNGASIYLYLHPVYDSFLLEKKFYKNDYQVGKYFGYHQNGQIRVEGDSVQSINLRRGKKAEYNNAGIISKYINVKEFDTIKKGKWKYYDEKGKLLYEEKL